jgi:hypothetical protein
MADHVNLKTLGQFILLADPSIQPCLVQGPEVKTLAKVIDHAAARKRRRIALAAFGKAAADSSAFPGKKVARLAPTVHGQVRKLARQRGFRAKKFTAFHVVGGENFGQAMKARDAEPKVWILVEQGDTVPSRKSARRVSNRRISSSRTPRMVTSSTSRSILTGEMDFRH